MTFKQVDFDRGGQVFPAPDLALQRRLLMAQQLQQQGADTSPVQHPLQAVARIAQALSGAYMGKKAEEGFADREKQTNRALAALLSGERDVGADPGVAGPARGQFAGDLGETRGRTDELAAILGGNEYLRPYAEQAAAAKQFPELFASEAKAPQTRTIKRGDREVTQEFRDGKYVDVAEAPLFRSDVLSPEAEAQKLRLAQAGRTPDRELVEIADATSPTGTRFVPRSQAAGQPGKPPSGLSLETGPDGRVVLRTGVTGVTGGIERATKTDIEGRLIGAREGLSRLRDIQARFKPEYQQILPRLGTAWTGLRARLGDGSIPPEDVRTLTEFSDYKRTALSNINQHIKDLTGAAMSEAEAGRIRRSVPDPGEGILGGDDPITFKANMDSVMRDLEKATARYDHYLNRGLSSPAQIERIAPLDSMDIAVNPDTGERIIKIGDEWVPLQ